MYVAGRLLYSIGDCVACRDKHCCELLDDMDEDTISEKDKLYFELTGLYWMWKNNQH